MVKLIHRDKLHLFIQSHPDADRPLRAWAQIVATNEFNHFTRLKKSFGSADYVRPHTVFNVSGNKYRLIVRIDYSLGVVYVEQVLTHSEYDKGKWRS